MYTPKKTDKYGYNLKEHARYVTLLVRYIQGIKLMSILNETTQLVITQATRKALLREFFKAGYRRTIELKNNS